MAETLDCKNKILNSLIPICQATKKPGGLDRRVWVCNFDDAVITYDDEGYIDGVVMTGSPVPKLYKFVGKDWKHNYGLEGQIGENLNTIKDTLNLVLNYFLPSERAAVEALFNAEKLIVFVQTKGDDGEACIEAHGVLNGMKSAGLNGGSGVQFNDSTAVTVALASEEKKLPKVLKLGSFLPTEEGYLAENISALDALAA